MFQPLKKYVDFKGRASRAEYWLFCLFNIIAAFLIAILFGPDSPLLDAAWLALLLPNLAVGARRLHDINMSAWWLLLGLIPFLGALALMVMALIRGTDGENRFGPDPLAEAV